MKLNKQVIVGLCAGSAMLVTGMATAQAGVSANIGVASNYIWRGQTQTSNSAATSGGIDYEHESGFYAGTWVSNIAGGDFEQDIYAGYGFKTGGIDLDVGYIMYDYLTAASDFSEIYIKGGMAGATLGYAMDSKNKDSYLSLEYATEVKKGMEVGFVYGSYSKNVSANSYSHIGLSLSKDDFKFAYDSTSGNGAAKFAGKNYSTFTVSWSKSFDL